MLSGASEPAAQRRRMTHIAPGTRVEGLVSGPTELLVDGEIQGEVRIESAVTIGTEGSVQGPVSAQVVRVGGRVIGNVLAVERVEVAPSGSLEGDIAAPRVVIAEGAFFKGRIEMRPDRQRLAERKDKPADRPALDSRGKQEPAERNERPNDRRPPKVDAGNGKNDPANGQKV